MSHTHQSIRWNEGTANPVPTPAIPFVVRLPVLPPPVAPVAPVAVLRPREPEVVLA